MHFYHIIMLCSSILHCFCVLGLSTFGTQRPVGSCINSLVMLDLSTRWFFIRKNLLVNIPVTNFFILYSKNRCCLINLHWSVLFCVVSNHFFCLSQCSLDPVTSVSTSERFNNCVYDVCVCVTVWMGEIELWDVISNWRNMLSWKDDDY